MKFVIASIAALLVSTAAKADIIKCVFTEPFVDFTYSMTQSTLTVLDHTQHPKTYKFIYKNISFQILGPAHFQLWNAKNQVVADLRLNNKGSDGMSDKDYPYQTIWYGAVTKYGKYNQLHGGCTSNFLHSNFILE